jgi:S1-C subfamily serine protease
MLVIAACVACGCGPRPAPQDDGRLYEAVRRASVFVLVDGRHAGSGFFVEPSGFVVTAAHMVKGKSEWIEVVSPIIGRVGAQRVAIDLGHDIALLRIPERRTACPSLPIAERMPPAGSEVFLFGDPVFRHRLLLAGFVSVAGPTYCHSPGVDCYTRVYYVAGTSPEGTSGGCWVDRQGRVVGVQSGFLNTTAKQPASIACVAPPDAIRTLLATKSSPDVPTLGTRLDELWTQPAGFIARFPRGTTGIVTVLPDKNGPVAQAGLTKESVITAIDGKPVTYLDDLLSLVSAKRPGDEVTLEVLDPDHKPRRAVRVRLAKVQE